jgi:hypothetical protein
MNVLNRLLAIVILLLILAVAVGAIGIATGLLTLHTVDRVYTYPPLHHALSDFHTSHPAETRLLKIGVAGIVGVLALLLLLAELTPPRRERTLRLVENRDGEVSIGYHTLRKVAEVASGDVSGVSRATCRVAGSKEALRVRCVATIDRYANAEAVGAQVEAAIKQQLERTLGTAVERVAVRVEPQTAKAPARVR